MIKQMKINKERRLFLKKTLQIGSGIYASAIIGKYMMNHSSPVTWGEDIPSIIPSTVVIARDDTVFTETGNVKEALVSSLLHKAVMQLTNARSQEKAWQALFKPHDIGGLRSNISWYSWYY